MPEKDTIIICGPRQVLERSNDCTQTPNAHCKNCPIAKTILTGIVKLNAGGGTYTFKKTSLYGLRVTYRVKNSKRHVEAGVYRGALNIPEGTILPEGN
jgi:hypothetical protein